MQQPTPRPEPMYSGAMTDENIRSIFQGAGDFIARELMCSGLRLYAYMIDGLVACCKMWRNEVLARGEK